MLDICRTSILNSPCQIPPACRKIGLHEPSCCQQLGAVSGWDMPKRLGTCQKPSNAISWTRHTHLGSVDLQGNRYILPYVNTLSPLQLMFMDSQKAAFINVGDVLTNKAAGPFIGFVHPAQGCTPHSPSRNTTLSYGVNVISPHDWRQWAENAPLFEDDRHDWPNLLRILTNLM